MNKCRWLDGFIGRWMGEKYLWIDRYMYGWTGRWIMKNG